MSIKSRLAVVMSIIVILTIILSGCGTANTGITAPPTTVPQADALTSVKTKLPPVLNGSADDLVWQVAPARVLDVTTNGIKPFQITLKSAYDDENVYFLVQWPDINKEEIRSPWAYNPEKKTWERLDDSIGDEDEFGFYWNYNVPNYEVKGCKDLCHDQDPNNKRMYTPAGTWVDIWQWTSSRSNPLGWMRDMRLTEDPNASSNPAGGFVEDLGHETNEGYADNVQTINGVDVPLYWKPFSGASGVIAGNPFFVLQSEIDSGLAKNIVQVDANGTLTDETGATIPWYARIPGRILSSPAGPSWNDVEASGAWLDGVWTVEVARKMNTGHEDDTQFDVNKPNYFDIYIKTRQAGEVDRQTVSVSQFVFGK